jgi:hypothetical protein
MGFNLAFEGLGMPRYGLGGWLPAVLSSRRPRFNLRTFSVGFSIDKVALGQVFLLVLQFSTVSIISPLLIIDVPFADTV